MGCRYGFTSQYPHHVVSRSTSFSLNLPYFSKKKPISSPSVTPLDSLDTHYYMCGVACLLGRHQKPGFTPYSLRRDVPSFHRRQLALRGSGGCQVPGEGSWCSGCSEGIQRVLSPLFFLLLGFSRMDKSLFQDLTWLLIKWTKSCLVNIARYGRKCWNLPIFVIFSSSWA